ncbi:hypothetical protein FRC03_004337 [Tulasnella sp. 419]|nr:hypothetical protein FRC03_004337 [Tulasnella sp. 419]
MRILGQPYNRDKVHSNIPIKKSADAEDYETWCPKSDIRVALNEGGSGYTLMTGETQSEGQSEKTATYKNALLSLHSWKVMHKLFGTVDHIILSVFISPFICTIYIFYKDEANNDFIHQGILRQNSMFGSKDKSVEFLRWMHNFAAIAKKHIRNPPKADRTVTQALKAIVPPTRATKQTATSGNDDGTDGQRNPKRSRTTPGGPSGNNTPADVIEALSDLGFEVHHASHHRDIVFLRRSEGRFVAKRIRRKVELEILEYLKAPHLSRYLNHTVPIIHILHLTSSNHALLVMPFHSVLSQLLRLSERWYYQLRFELVEAVAFLHDLGIVHRDIKPDNLLVDFKAASSPHLFVIDFGIAIWHSDNDQLCVGFHGTEGWTAPEVHEGAQWDPRAAEVWAVGKTLKYMTKVTICTMNST